MAKLIDVLEHEASMHYRDKVGVLLRQAASEIRALQNRLRRKASGKKQSLALTNEERETLAKVLRRTREDFFTQRYDDSVTIAAVVDGLLERTK